MKQMILNFDEKEIPHKTILKKPSNVLKISLWFYENHIWRTMKSFKIL